MVIAFSTVLVPLLDVIRVVLHRLREHKNPFLPDKNHFHHTVEKAITMYGLDNVGETSFVTLM